MITPFLILLIAIFLFGLGGGATIWLFLRWRRLVKSKTPRETATTAEALPFHWRYIILPVAILSLSICLVAYFYYQLPNEVAYHFKSDGSPDRWLSRETITVWMLVLQFVLTLMAGATTAGLARVGILSQKADGGSINPSSVLSLMGNMIGLPQLVLCFAMVDIFSYNAYQIHLIPLWVFAIIVMGLGTIVLILGFISAVRQARKVSR